MPRNWILIGATNPASLYLWQSAILCFAALRGTKRKRDKEREKDDKKCGCKGICLECLGKGNARPKKTTEAKLCPASRLARAQKNMSQRRRQRWGGVWAPGPGEQTDTSRDVSAHHGAGFAVSSLSDGRGSGNVSPGKTQLQGFTCGKESRPKHLEVCHSYSISALGQKQGSWFESWSNLGFFSMDENSGNMLRSFRDSNPHLVAI